MTIKATIDEHVEAGIMLSLMRNKLVESIVFVSNTNGKTKVRTQTDRLETALRLIDQTRSDLDNLVCREFNTKEQKEYLKEKYGYINGTTDIYYCNDHLDKNGNFIKDIFSPLKNQNNI